ncbi:MAG: hypothetical protein ACLTW9_28935 [Enterocloster sp.]
MKRAIEITSWLGADRMLLCPGNGYADEPEEDIFWKRCRASYGRPVWDSKGAGGMF